jgi:hypothetical protein
MNTLQFSFAPYEPQQRDALLEFRTAHYEAGSFRTDPAYVDWLYLDTFQSRPGRPCSYVCEDGQRIIGTHALLHVRLKAGTEKVSAAWVAEFAVRKELQRGRAAAPGCGNGTSGFGAETVDGSAIYLINSDGSSVPEGC